MLINENRLLHLLSVAEHAHFGRAAASLNISQPALSKSIQNLEAELGVQLLDRGKNGVVLTLFGEITARHGKVLLNGYNELLRELRLSTNLEIGSLRVALGPYPSVISGYAAAGELIALHPKLKVSLSVDSWKEVARKIFDLEADIGLAELSLIREDERFITELIGQHRGRFFCRPGHPLLEQGVALQSALFEYPWISTRLPARSAKSFPREPTVAGSFDTLTGEFVPTIEFDAPIQLASLIADTDAVAFSALGLLEEELKAGLLVPVPGLSIVANYGFIYLKKRPLAPASKAYIEAVRSVEQAYCLREKRLEKKYLALL